MLAAALHSRSSCSSSTSTGSRGCGWRQPGGPLHDWTLRGAGLPPLALCAASQPHAGWAWVGGPGHPGSVVLALGPSPQPESQRPQGRWGRKGPGSLWAPPWLPKGRALQQQGLKSDGRRNSCGVLEGGRRREPSIGWGWGRSASHATRRAEPLPDPKGWGRGRTGCPASAPPHQAEGGRETRKPGFFRPPL